MATQPSFAPLAARLAAHSAALRLVQDGRDGFGAALMATFWRLVLEYLIYTCEKLDARAAAELAGAVATPAPRDAKTGVVPSPRAIRQAPPGNARAFRLALAPQPQTMLPGQADAPSGAIERFILAAPRLVWSRDPGPIRAALAPPWRPHRETRLSRQYPCTPKSLRYRIESLAGEVFQVDGRGPAANGVTAPPRPWRGGRDRPR